MGSASQPERGPAPVQRSAQRPPAGRSGPGPDHPATTESAAGLVANLARPGMLTAQRRALMLQAGSVLGNRQLAGVVATVQRDPEDERVKALKKNYEDAVKAADWKLAAEYLNGFSREDILTRLAKRSAAEVGELHTGAVGNPRVGPGSQLALLTPVLLTDFAGKFRASAELIRRSPEALTLIREAEAASVKFGGYAEDGPAKDAWPYTVEDTVYVPRAHTNKIVAMSDFLFELNNAIRKPEFAKIDADATAGTIDAKQYAYKTVEQEVEGMLRLGKVWFETKKALGGGKRLNAYNEHFYLAEYKAFEKGRKTKDQIIKDVLKRKYTAGKDKGKTVEKYYMEQYKTLHP
jgi:hypothetical protein